MANSMFYDLQTLWALFIRPKIPEISKKSFGNLGIPLEVVLTFRNFKPEFLVEWKAPYVLSFILRNCIPTKLGKVFIVEFGTRKVIVSISFTICLVSICKR